MTSVRHRSVRARAGWWLLGCLAVAGAALLPATLTAQRGFKAPVTPLRPATLEAVRNEVSGALAYNLEMVLAGFNHVRGREEFDGFMYEAQQLHQYMKGVGVDDLRIESLEKDTRPAADAGANWWVATDAELWMVEPSQRRLGRLAEDPALVARMSDTVDAQAEVVYLDRRDLPRLAELDVAGKIILTPENSSAFAPAIAKGALGVVSYFDHAEPIEDPDQVNFDMAFRKGRTKNKAFAFQISPRLGYELRDLVMDGQRVVLHAKSSTNAFPWKLDTVFAAIKGTQPEKKGLLFTAHLFERPAKQGANDNVSGCVVEAEVARTLAKLIADGKIPRPERSIYFLWSEEGSGTMAFFKKYPAMAGRVFGVVNMDMVGENLDENDAYFNIETPYLSKATFLDAAVRSFAEYVFQSNIEKHSYMSPSGTTAFPVPILERRGTRQAFRYLVNPHDGGSDHDVFLEADVPIPALSLNVWPDRYYHTDKDLPEKSDPTQMKRVAFIAATAALSVTSGDAQTLEGLVVAAANDRQAFVGGVLARAIQQLSSSTASDQVGAYRVGVANLRQAGRVSLSALEGLRDFTAGRPDLEAFLQGAVGSVDASVKGALGQLARHRAALAAARGVKVVADPAPLADERRLETTIASKVKPLALGDRFPYMEVFQSIKDQAFQQRLYEKYNRNLQIEMFLAIDGHRTLLEVRDLLALEFGTPVEIADFDKLVEAFKQAKLIECNLTAATPAGKAAKRTRK